MSMFTKVKMPKVGSSSFNLSHDIKLSFDMGELIPTCVMDVLPGDKFRISTESMLRFSPLIAPVMHKYKVHTEYFFVPNRLLWKDWEEWIVGEKELIPPVINGYPGTVGTLGDYLGIPQMGANATGGLPISAYPIAAYALIYDEYYRDQNLSAEKSQVLLSGFNNWARDLAAGQPLKRAWMHDYFTSCLPFAQKGDAVTLPLLNEDALPVQYKEQSGLQILRKAGGGNEDDPFEAADWIPTGSTTGGTTPGSLRLDDTTFSGDARLDLGDTHEVLINQEASTIETLRRAFRLQEWLEKNARGGTRYIEHIKAHFGVFSSDARLQRPEYIGGTRSNMMISEVLATANTEVGTDETPVGDLAGHGIGVQRGSTYTYRAEEHGWIIGITSVTPMTAYYQGLPKMWQRNSYLDYYWPSFANLGEQEVKNSEIYVSNETLEKLDETFGYIPRYAEYKYMNSRVAGEMKSTLEFWQHGRKFATAPGLNETFIKCEPDKRIFAVTSPDVDSIYAHVFNNIKAIRKMPKYAMPTI